MPNKVDLAYIKMAMACVRPEPIKNHIKQQLTAQCPLSAAKILQIIATAKQELPPNEYTRRENNVINAIKEGK